METKDMTLAEIIESIIKSGKQMSRMERAISNYQTLTGKRAPDDLHHSWADRL